MQQKLSTCLCFNFQTKKKLHLGLFIASFDIILDDDGTAMLFISMAIR